MSPKEERAYYTETLYRYPDITATKGKRTIYYQIGRAKVDGSPIAREARALYDLRNKGYIVFLKSIFLKE